MVVRVKKIRKGISAVVFRRNNGKLEFLVLHRIKRWTGWEMLKGGRIGRELPINNLFRELKEEINVTKRQVASIIEMPNPLRFKTSSEYLKKNKYTHMEFKSYIVELVGEVSIKHNEVLEHDEYRWVDYKTALKLLTFDTSKEQLNQAYSFIKKRKFS